MSKKGQNYRQDQVSVNTYEAEPRTHLSIATFPGGGTQGIISSYLASEFENKSERPFHESFDQIAGLSVGSLNAAALWPLRSTGAPAVGTEALKDIYLNKIDSAFVEKFWALGGLLDNKYDIAGLTALIEDTFGDLKLSDFEDGLHIYVVDVDRKELRVLSSEKAALDPREDFRMADLLRSAVAAPIYFEPVELESMAGTKAHFVDGGLFNTDPSFKAYFDATQQFGNGTNIALTTFGTGHTRSRKVDLDDMNGGFGTAGAILHTHFSANTNTFDDMLKRALGSRHVKLDVDITGSGIDMVAEDIRKVIPYAEEAVISNQDNIQRAIDNTSEVERKEIEPDISGISILDARGVPEFTSVNTPLENMHVA